MGCHRPLIIVERHHLHGPDIDHASVIDEHINISQLHLDLLHHGRDLYLIGHIAGRREDIGTPLREFRAGPIQFGGIAGAEGEARPFAGHAATS